MPGVAVLPQAAGYGIVLGIGFFFSGFMICLSWMQNRYTSFKTSNVEEFTSASGAVKPGLIASGIVSAWTWAATLLQSSAVAYKFGISGPWWYAAGATIQVMLFAMNAAKLKMNAPKAHTFLEVIGDRWGTAAHLTFMFFGLMTNIIVSSMLILGGSACVTDLTGMPTLAACFLIPVAVAVYVVVGGMRATLLCDYTHTTLLFVFILVFMFTVYATSDKIGSPSAMYRLLQDAAARTPIEGNAQGSFLTMRSHSGAIFGVINIVGNFGTVFVDQAYWQRGIASRPSSAVKAFIIGGTAWFAIPFGFATCLGLTARALSTNPSFPGYPAMLTAGEVSAGLPAPAAAAALLGKSGAAMILVLLFLAVTSATSAEMVAVASVLSFDIYRKYFNPKATAEQVLRVDMMGIALYGIVMGLLGLIWFYVGLSMGWLYEAMGNFISSAVVPIALAIMSRKANKWGCIAGAWIGLACSIVVWMVTTAKLNDNAVTITTTGQDYPMLAGNLTALGVGAIISVGASLIWPEDYDFRAGKSTMSAAMETNSQEEKSEYFDTHAAGAGKKEGAATSIAPAAPEPEEDLAGLQKAFKLATTVSVALTVVLILLIPLPLYFSNYVFTSSGFTGWVAVAITWVFYSIFAVVIYPVYESRHSLAVIVSGVIRDVMGGGLRKKQATTA